MLFILNEEEGVEEGEHLEVQEEDKVELKQLDTTEELEVEYQTITGLTTKGTMK